MREVVILGILLVNIAIQSSVFPFIQIFHVKPDSLLILVVSFALLAGNPTGALVGFFGGLIQDILFGNNIGLYALQYMVIGYIVGLLYGKLYVDKFFVPIVTIGLSNIIKQVIMFIYNFFMQSRIPFKKVVFQIVLPETLYTVILGPIIFYYIYQLYHKKFMRKKSRFIKSV